MNKKKMIVDKYNTVYSFDVYVVLNPSKDELDKLFKWSESDNIKSEKMITAYMMIKIKNTQHIVV